jgi:bifunctional UDP-N-acetylglucosamine pyrophosphorylase / glucosamine-1-phosphate N-acetyltransferase
MKIIVLAAGKSTRFKSKKHKALHELHGKTILERILDTLWELKPTQIQMVLGHQLEQISQELKRGETVTEQKEQLGAGHALQIGLKGLTHDPDGFLVVYGDTPLFRSQTLAALIQSTKQHGASIGVLTAQAPNPFGYGRIIKEGEFVKSIIEEKDANAEQRQITEINAGAYYLRLTPEELDEGLANLKPQNSQKEYYLTDLVEWANQKGLKVVRHFCPDFDEVLGINTRAELAQAYQILSERRIKELQSEGVTFINPASTTMSPQTTIAADTVIYPNCYFAGQTSIGSDCQIGPNCYIESSMIGAGTTIRQSQVVKSSIGQGCWVGPFANLRPDTKLSDEVHIGDFVEIKNSKIAFRSKVPHLSYIGDAQIAEDVNIGAGTITANYNAISGEKSLTQIGREVKVGSNSVLVAPVQLADGCFVAAGTVVTEDVLSENSLVVGRFPQEVKQDWVTQKKKKLGKKK